MLANREIPAPPLFAPNPARRRLRRVPECEARLTPKSRAVPSAVSARGGASPAVPVAAIITVGSKGAGAQEILQKKRRKLSTSPYAGLTVQRLGLRADGPILYPPLESDLLVSLALQQQQRNFSLRRRQIPPVELVAYSNREVTYLRSRLPPPVFGFLRSCLESPLHLLGVSAEKMQTRGHHGNSQARRAYQTAFDGEMHERGSLVIVVNYVRCTKNKDNAEQPKNGQGQAPFVLSVHYLGLQSPPSARRSESQRSSAATTGSPDLHVSRTAQTLTQATNPLSTFLPYSSPFVYAEPRWRAPPCGGYAGLERRQARGGPNANVGAPLPAGKREGAGWGAAPAPRGRSRTEERIM